MSPAPPPVEPGPAPPPEETRPALALRLAGGAFVWYYQPFLPKYYAPNFSVPFLQLKITATYGDYGVYLFPQFRDTRLTGAVEGTSWIEEAYVWTDLGPASSPARLKAGKIYSQLGLFWDNSFYGNVQLYDALKLAPENGLSLEGRAGAEDRYGVRYALQFFPVDGRTNFALRDRDVVWIPGARRRYQTIVRGEPFVQLTKTTSLRGALTAQYLQADLPVGKKNVFRAAIDATLRSGGWGLWGELIYQNGQTVTDFPYAGVPATDTSPAIPGRASASNYYVLVGGEYKRGRLTGRSNFSYGRYADLSVSEWIIQPGLGIAFNDNVSVLAEFVVWRHSAPEGDSFVDRSLSVALHGRFSALVVGEE